MPSPSSPSLDTRAFCLTVSVIGDISDECIKALVKHIRSTTEHSYVVTEHGANGKLHLHAVMLYKDSRSSKKLHENIWDRQVKPFHPTSKGSIAVKVQVCPGNDWYDTYLQKESDCTVLLDNYDREEALAYFPTEAVQEALMAKGKLSGLASPWLEQDTIAWAASTFVNSPAGALMYLKNRMFILKNMQGLADKRKLAEKALMYWEYRNGVISPSPKELKLLHELEMNDPYIGPSVVHDPLFSSAPASI